MWGGGGLSSGGGSFHGIEKSSHSFPSHPPTDQVLCKGSWGNRERRQPPARIPRHRLTAPASAGTAELCEMSGGVMLMGPLAPSLCGLHFLPSALCSSDGNQRVQLEDNLPVPHLIWGPFFA